MFRRDEVTSTVRIVEVIGGDPAYVTLTQRATRPDGKVRTITQKVPVRDPALLARLTADIAKGDEIEATIVTERSKNDYVTYLSDFHHVSATTSNQNLASIVRNFS